MTPSHDTLYYIVDVLFSIALFINTILFLPQAYRLFKEKRADEVSLATFGGFNILQLIAIIYGFMHHDYILAIGYILSFITCFLVSIQIVIYRLNK